MKGMFLHIQDRAAFEAVWQALDQYVSNADEALHVYGGTAEDHATLEAARELLAQIESTITKLAG